MVSQEHILSLLKEKKIDKIISYGKEAVDPLIECLTNEKWFVRKTAAKLLGELKDIRALEPLIKCLTDENWFVRELVAEVLMELKDIRAVDPLIKCLNDEHLFVREAAVKSLGKLKDIRALEPLIKCLTDEFWGVRKSAAIALGELNDKKAVEPLIECLTDDIHDVREEAAEAIMKINDPKGIEFRKIISGDKSYIQQIGLEQSKKVVNEYLALIEDSVPKERFNKIRSELSILLRKAINNPHILKKSIELPEPKNLRNTNNSGMDRKLRQVSL